MPVGRIQYLQLGPVTFEEFLLAFGENQLIEEMAHYHPGTRFPSSAHTRLVERQREFLFLGGMPEAVAAYAAQSTLSEIENIHDSILNTYQDDFVKYKKRVDPLQLKLIFQKIPAQVGCKIKYTHFSREQKARDIHRLLQLLSLARVMTPVFQSQCTGIPLGASADLEVYKPLFLDVGLMNRFLGLKWAQIFKQDEIALINEGALAEQFIGQHLLFLESFPSIPCLYYWLREGKTGNAEVDYVMSYGGHDLFPIEVKAGTTGQLKSLHQFAYAKKNRFAIRFNLGLPTFGRVNTKLISAGSHTVQFSLLSLPLYFVGQLLRLMKELIEDEGSFLKV
ncbi:MAG: DUF4143 domain-containing protein [Gammaproteobacteria bacterium]|nr:DUF4143 domain-containing protein [Gammaproteobacteria bacterium]